MRWTQALIPTLKEDPQDAEVISHKLMVRAGLIRKLISGAYSYLPLGFRVLQKVSNIIREEMRKIGGQEILMPALHPKDIWAETGVFALLAWLFMFGAAARGAYGKIKKLPVIALGCLAALAYFGAHSFFETAIFNPTVLAFLMIVLGLSLRTTKTYESTKRISPLS